MTGGPIQVDYATLHKAAADVRSTRHDVDGELKKLLGTAEELQGAWEGAAALQFQGLIRRWNDDSTKLLNALSEIADLLDKAARQHQATDEQSQQMFGKYDNALGG